MSNTWPPQQEPPPQARWPQSGWPQSWYPPQPPPYDEPGYGYGAGFGTGYSPGYGAPGPVSAGRPGGWPPPQGDPWSQWGREPPQEMYQPGRPPPPLLPYSEAPRGASDPYGLQDPYWAQGPYGAYGPYGTHPTQSRRSRNWFVPVVVLLVFAILVAAGGAYALARYGPATTNLPATAAGTASRTPSIPSGFHAYINATIGVQFDVPNGWTIDDNIAASGGTGMQATSPDATALLAASSFPGKGGNLVGAEDAVFIGLSDSKTVDNKEGPTQVTFGGATWEREAGDITHSQLRVHMVVLIVTHGFTTYVLAFLATTSSFTAVDTHVFQRTSRSFRFRS